MLPGSNAYFATVVGLDLMTIQQESTIIVSKSNRRMVVFVRRRLPVGLTRHPAFPLTPCCFISCSGMFVPGGNYSLWTPRTCRSRRYTTSFSPSSGYSPSTYAGFCRPRVSPRVSTSTTSFCECTGTTADAAGRFCLHVIY